jgi:hypothetical protein
MMACGSLNRGPFLILRRKHGFEKSSSNGNDDTERSGEVFELYALTCPVGNLQEDNPLHQVRGVDPICSV